MKVVFVSNYLNHHQLPFCLSMVKALGDDFVFIATTPVSEARKSLGYRDMNSDYSFTICAYKSSTEYEKSVNLANNADITVIDGVYTDFYKQRLKFNRITFKFAERPLRNGIEPLKYIPRLLKWHHQNPMSRQVYMLCASAYTSSDYEKFGLFINRCFKWGYFTELKKYDDIDTVLNNKESASLLWVGRFLELKHPESALEVARRLKSSGVKFKLRIVGDGPLRESMEMSIASNGLSDCVELIGAVPPETVRQYMEKSEIFLFNSDFNEGWGAVLNEAMNSACAVVASHAIGSVPYLIDDGRNGYIYKYGDLDSLYNKVLILLNNSQLRRGISKNAYITMSSLWNADVAAERFISVCKRLINGKSKPSYYDNGPCSPAKITNNNWYKG